MENTRLLKRAQYSKTQCTADSAMDSARTSTMSRHSSAPTSMEAIYIPIFPQALHRHVRIVICRRETTLSHLTGMMIRGASELLAKAISLDVQTLGYEWLLKAGTHIPKVVVNTKITTTAGHRIPDG